MSEKKRTKTQERVQSILQLLSQGKTREDIALKYKMKTWKSIDMFMRRQGYRWDPDEGTYFPKEEEQASDIHIEEDVQKNAPEHDDRAEDIIIALQRARDIRVVARQFQFKNHRDLGAYMRSKHYYWNAEQNNYTLSTRKESTFIEKLLEQIPSFTNIRYHSSQSDGSGLEKFYPVFEFLNENLDGLKNLLTYPQEAQGVQPVQPNSSNTNIEQTNQNEYKVPVRSSIYELIHNFAEETSVNPETLLENAIKQYILNHNPATP